ncbi:hypothetical protein K469DRAFT_707167 [Zopfia rhizophila CBS 207.26]|uniref:Malate dehydrogenase n=1 Tax=Zopfia rhizophila CBS 207.26 TaxID=1314779 RepID=A0A6A6E4Q7_9PEZI|nr:hypothetical protein K469DRAFT_707167 [Zopfia rhizophila CBS 207.26]
MLSSTLSAAVMALSLLTSAVTAVPTWGPPWGHPDPRAGQTPNLSRLKMPQNTLPPPTGLQLKFVGLGLGTQNYTCGSDGTAQPGSNGAVAKLYDLGTRLNSDPMAQWKLGSISGLALSLSSNQRMLDGYLQSQGYQRILGDHYFNAAKTPTFSLNKVLPLPFPLLYAFKNASMAAPQSACPGTKNEGAVPWLKLDDAGGSEGGVNTVYRLETAGGMQPATCQGMKATFEVPYAAQYWVYGPK